MSAKTKWWFCGKCGFKNHPRAQQDATKCEQCGHDQKSKSNDPAEVEAIANDTDYQAGA